MKKDRNIYVFGFALLICAACSLSLAFVSEGLKSRQELNQALDSKKNILKAAGIALTPQQRSSPQQVLELYGLKIEEAVIDDEGNRVEGKTPEMIRPGETLWPLYIYREEGRVQSYCFPVSGKGLWSTLYGYFALAPDGVTVRGITFYKHNETPGLGAEIEKDWFQGNFRGKKIWDEGAGALRPVQVFKGRVRDRVPAEDQPFYVDGISGATMTSKGVSALLDQGLKTYEPFFRKIRGVES